MVIFQKVEQNNNNKNTSQLKYYRKGKISEYWHGKRESQT